MFPFGRPRATSALFGPLSALISDRLPTRLSGFAPLAIVPSSPAFRVLVWIGGIVELAKGFEPPTG
jgi:hypothetical protein